MHYIQGGPEHFEHAPEKALVRLKHDDGREFFAVTRDVGADFWYLKSDGSVAGGSMPMGRAIFQKTTVIARRSTRVPDPNWATAGVLPKSQHAEPKAKPEAARSASAMATAEQRQQGVQQTAAPLPADHQGPEDIREGSEMLEAALRESTHITETVCRLHGVVHSVNIPCHLCARDQADGLTPECDRKSAPEKLQQVGGRHYDDMPIDVFEFCESNGLGFVESTAIKYLTRRKGDSRIEDLKKAISCIERLIKHEETGSWAR